MNLSFDFLEQLRSPWDTASGFLIAQWQRTLAQITAGYNKQHNSDDTHGTITASGSISERGRTVPMGDWTDQAYASTDFTASGAMIWTVSSTNFGHLRYMLVGSTMFVDFRILGSALSGSGDTTLKIALPNRAQCANDSNAAIRFNNVSASGGGEVRATAGLTTLSLTKADQSAWDTSHAVDVTGQIAVPIIAGSGLTASTTLAVDILVVGGGGGGGGASTSPYGGAGGGGGRVKTASTTLTVGSAITVTVGSGGPGHASGNGAVTGTNGGDSSAIGGAVSITANGGGGGANPNASTPSTGAAGGNGGGGAGTGSGGGTTDSGHTGGASLVAFLGGGGAGDGANGGNSSSSPSGSAGAGGQGTSNSYSGAAVVYGSGGGGGAWDTGSGNSGGTNAGSGSNNGGINGGNAVANTGSGGGGGGCDSGGVTASNGGNGSAGIVIIRYLGAQRATGGTYSASGGYSIHTFTSNGTFSL